MERIDKIIASQTQLSRKQAQSLIRSKKVSVNGKLCTSPEEKFDPETAEIIADGEPVIYKKYLYIMMNKPAGVLSASNDKNARTVIDLLPPELRRDGLFPAGRLDKDTTGLLIITDDGDFAHNMLSPKKHVDKIYQAQLSGPVTEETVSAFKSGITLRDGTEYLPAELWTLAEFGDSTGFVKIREGKFHQVKKMFLACGLEVLELKRIQIGQLLLDENLANGKARELDSCELSLIFL